MSARRGPRRDRVTAAHGVRRPEPRGSRSASASPASRCSPPRTLALSAWLAGRAGAALPARVASGPARGRARRSSSVLAATRRAPALAFPRLAGAAVPGALAGTRSSLAGRAAPRGRLVFARRASPPSFLGAASPLGRRLGRARRGRCRLATVGRSAGLAGRRATRSAAASSSAVTAGDLVAVERASPCSSSGRRSRQDIGARDPGTARVGRTGARDEREDRSRPRHLRTGRRRTTSTSSTRPGSRAARRGLVTARVGDELGRGAQGRVGAVRRRRRHDARASTTPPSGTRRRRSSSRRCCSPPRRRAAPIGRRRPLGRHRRGRRGARSRSSSPASPRRSGPPRRASLARSGSAARSTRPPRPCSPRTPTRLVAASCARHDLDPAALLDGGRHTRYLVGTGARAGAPAADLRRDRCAASSRRR